jgi:hypothetical protein
VRREEKRKGERKEKEEKRREIFTNKYLIH